MKSTSMLYPRPRYATIRYILLQLPSSNGECSETCKTRGAIEDDSPLAEGSKLCCRINLQFATQSTRNKLQFVMVISDGDGDGDDQR